MKEMIQELPLSPGVYLMKDSRGQVIYVGKSKCLKKRVQSYFYNNKSHSPKIKKLVHHVKSLEHIVTDTEFEAFLLECRLIQDIKPMYNRRMKNPLGYSYVVLRHKGAWRRLEITNTPDGAGRGDTPCIGPYTASRSSVENALQTIQECCRIACSSQAISASSENTPCLNYSLGLCLGRCLGGEAARQYEAAQDRLTALLQGKDDSLYEEMGRQMLDAAEQFDFEQAAKYRDALEAMKFLLSKKQVIEFAEKNHSIAVYEHLDEHTIKFFLIKNNAVVYSEPCSVASTADLELLLKKVQRLILSYFPGHMESAATGIQREEIDSAQIIYIYLQSSACRYLLVPETWLDEGGQPEMEGALREFLPDPCYEN